MGSNGLWCVHQFVVFLLKSHVSNDNDLHKLLLFHSKYFPIFTDLCDVQSIALIDTQLCSQRQCENISFRFRSNFCPARVWSVLMNINFPIAKINAKQIYKNLLNNCRSERFDVRRSVRKIIQNSPVMYFFFKFQTKIFSAGRSVSDCSYELNETIE